MAIRYLIFAIGLGVMGLAPSRLQAQGLVELTGAGAIQGSLRQSGSAGLRGADSVRSARNAADQFNAAQQNRQSALATPTQSTGTISPAVAGGKAAPLTKGSTRVNGQGIPKCSHGNLCHSSLLRAMGSDN